MNNSVEFQSRHYQWSIKGMGGVINIVVDMLVNDVRCERRDIKEMHKLRNNITDLINRMACQFPECERKGLIDHGE